MLHESTAMGPQIINHAILGVETKVRQNLIGIQEPMRGMEVEDQKKRKIEAGVNEDMGSQRSNEEGQRNAYKAQKVQKVRIAD